MRATPIHLKTAHFLCLIIAAILIAAAIPTKVYSVTPADFAHADPFAGYALLKNIDSCEDWGVPNKEPFQFNADGSVLRGKVNPQDIGMGQINLPTWGAQARELGYDLYTYQGNLEMQKWIFDNYGSRQWKYSEWCWKDS